MATYSTLKMLEAMSSGAKPESEGELDAAEMPEPIGNAKFSSPELKPSMSLSDLQIMLNPYGPKNDNLKG